MATVKASDVQVGQIIHVELVKYADGAEILRPIPAYLIGRADNAATVLGTARPAFEGMVEIRTSAGFMITDANRPLVTSEGK